MLSNGNAEVNAIRLPQALHRGEQLSDETQPFVHVGGTRARRAHRVPRRHGRVQP